MFPEGIYMNVLPVQEHSSIRPPRVHCPYCGDNFILSHGRRLEGFGVVCPNVKCGSRIRMNIRLSEREVSALNEY